MKHKLLAALVVILLITTVAVASVRAGKRDVTRPMHDAARQVLEFYGPQAAHTALYTGSETCLACHSGPNAVHGYDTADWRNTFHAFPFLEEGNNATFTVTLSIPSINTLKRCPYLLFLFHLCLSK